MTAAFDIAGTIPGISPEVFGERDFHAVARLIQRHAGIFLPPGKAMLVFSRLSPLVRNAGSTTFGSYLERIADDKEELERAVAALTTNHTFFYREPHHFDHFARSVRPDLLRRIEDGSQVRVWSAGCSSGEEPWSLAMTLLGPDHAAGARLAARDVRILATDLAAHALQKARAGIYPQGDLHAVPEALRKAWTAANGDMATIAETPRAIVTIRQLNLQEAWPMRCRFEVIFCRNVMIYFDGPTKERLLARFAEALVPGGFLYIGHSERVTGPASDVLSPVGPTIYRKVVA